MKKLAFALLCLLFAGCLKRDESHVNQTCVNNCITFNVLVTTGANAATPLANAAIELGWNRPATPLGNPGRLIAKRKTDANGRVQLSFSPKQSELTSGKFYINVTRGDRHFKSSVSHYDINRSDTTINEILYLPPDANLKIVVNNFTPQQKEDYLFINVQYDNYQTYIEGTISRHPSNIKGSSYTWQTPPFSRNEIQCITAGDAYNVIHILKSKGGVKTETKDSIYLRAGERREYEVRY